jgi:hypothetical protein
MQELLLHIEKKYADFKKEKLYNHNLIQKYCCCKKSYILNIKGMIYMIELLLFNIKIYEKHKLCMTLICNFIYSFVETAFENTDEYSSNYIQYTVLIYF